MIKICVVIAAAAAALFAGPANADVIYDTLHTTIGQLSATAIAAPTAGPLGISFDFPVATTITDIRLLMNANTPTDGGTVAVFLVPDDGSGGPGKAGLPAGGTAFTGKLALGTIADSSLTLAGNTVPPQSAGIVDLPESMSLAAGEYWLGFTETSGSAKLVFDNGYTATAANSTGTAFQKDFTQTANFGTYLVTGLARDFQAEIATPEPTSLVLLGVGMAAIGLLRRRRF
jgi:hypothetical protein